MDRERLDGWCERGILGLVLAILLYSPLAFGAVRPIDQVVIQSLTCVALVLWAVRMWVNPRYRLLWPSICWAILAFLAYAVFRYWMADIEYVARQEVLKVGVYASVFFLILNNCHSQRATRAIAFTLVGVAAVVAMYGLYQAMTGSDRVWHLERPAGYERRISGTYINPNHFAGLLEMVLPASLAYAFLGRVGYVTRILLVYAAVVMTGGLLFSVSRGAWVAAAVGLGFLFLVLILHLRSPMRWIALGAGAVVVIAAVGWGTRDLYVKGRFQVYQTEFAPGTYENIRFRLWRPAVAIWKEHVWLGAGPGHYEYLFPKHRMATPHLQLRPWRAHNDYLNTLADWGVVGLGLIGVVLAILGLSAVKSWRVFRRSGGEFGSSGSNRFALLVGGIGGLSAILMHSFIDFNMHIPANALVVVTLMAVLSGQLRFVTEGYWRGGGLMIRLVLGLLIAGSAGYLAVHAVRRAQAERYSHRAMEIRTLSEERLALLEMAYAWEPGDGAKAAAVGEHLRQLSWQGAAGYEELARQAIEWFKRAVELNPYDAASHVRLGMGLDWLKRFEEGDAAFERALSLDPAGHRTVGLYGWHLFQKGEIKASMEYLDRALRLSHGKNQIARVYQERAREELARERGAK